jgi:predicted negative regulator of RcsB-dependent stress response
MNSETQPSKWDEILIWIEANWKIVTVLVAALIIVGFGIYVQHWRSEQAELAASQRLLELRQPPRTEPETARPPAASYLQVAQEFPNTTAAERAQLLAAGTLFAENRYAEARAEFEKFLQRWGQSLFAPTAAYGLAAALEAETRQEEAFKAYEQVVQRHPRHPVADDARLDLARIHEARDQPELALKIYDEMSSPTAPSPRMADVMRRKEYLLARHPELATEDSPSAAVSLEPSPTLPFEQP